MWVFEFGGLFGFVVVECVGEVFGVEYLFVVGGVDCDVYEVFV